MAALGEMIGNIAHQWRQPLSVISTCASGMHLNLDLGLSKPEDLETNINMIMKTTDELSNTIDTFRDFTYKDKLVDFDLSELVGKCIDTEDYILSENQIEVITKLDETIKIVNLPNSLFQALINIIQNAIEALNKTAINRKIFICSRVNDHDEVELTIKDNAGGIKTEHIHKIFEPYFTTKHKSHGIGLGLNIVYKIINDSMCGKSEQKIQDLSTKVSSVKVHSLLLLFQKRYSPILGLYKTTNSF